MRLFFRRYSPDNLTRVTESISKLSLRPVHLDAVQLDTLELNTVQLDTEPCKCGLIRHGALAQQNFGHSCFWTAQKMRTGRQLSSARFLRNPKTTLPGRAVCRVSCLFAPCLIVFIIKLMPLAQSLAQIDSYLKLVSRARRSDCHSELDPSFSSITLRFSVLKIHGRM